MTVDGWLPIDTSESTADLVTEARRASSARLARVINEALGKGHGGRFDGQPLVDALQPLLEQRVLPAQPPKRQPLTPRKARVGAGGKRTRVMAQRERERAPGGKKPKRLLSKYRYGRRRG